MATSVQASPATSGMEMTPVNVSSSSSSMEKSSPAPSSMENSSAAVSPAPPSMDMSSPASSSSLGKVVAFWRTWVVLLTPLLLCPLLVTIGTSEAKMAFVLGVMAVLWVTEATPLPVTALLPVILIPLLGIMSTDEICLTYLKESNMMFIGSMMVAISVEHCGLHQRIALQAIIRIGTSPRLLMLGFMVPTAFLSAWISNSATTSMMVPIVEAVLVELEEHRGSTTAARDPAHRQGVRTMLYLSVAYAANTGGVATLTGTGPNLVLKGMVSQMFGGQTPLNFASWMGFAVPTVLVNLALCWCWLQIYFLGLPCRRSRLEVGDREGVRRVLVTRYSELGPVTFQQVAVLGHFLILIGLWFFRQPRFMPGWGELFVESVTDSCGRPTSRETVDDATSSMIIVFSLFVFPAEPSFWPFTSLAESRPSRALLDWPYVQKKFPWGVALLFGGGFALAEASKKSGLSQWVGSELKVLDGLPDWGMVLVICLLVGGLTEVTSNVATANILLPVLSELAKATKTNPLYLMIPATVTCSYAFMLPVATPPNAIAHQASGMSTFTMIKVGLVLNILCIAVNMAAINSYALWMFDLSTFPDWANTTAACPE